MDVFVMGSHAVHAAWACDAQVGWLFVQPDQPSVSRGGQNAPSDLDSLGRLISALSRDNEHDMKCCYQAELIYSPASLELMIGGICKL